MEETRRRALQQIGLLTAGLFTVSLASCDKEKNADEKVDDTTAHP